MNHIQLSTLCYIRKNDQYLMLHRTSKENDINKDKWIGVGGHFEEGESPEECLIREVREETGLTLLSYKLRGIVTFHSGGDINEIEYMFLYTADEFCGTQHECDEGELKWIDIEKIPSLNLWEGDRVFLKLLYEDAPFFSLKLIYDGNGGLVESRIY